ncbi:MAG TPA: hypothetical protein VFA07_03635 [Chthonomonadaceae bacterium]|nr:hypothetical protein [Chthonomonadaceae bacterium]
MNLLYRLMGIIARVSERLSHTRVNFVPINLAAIAGLILLFGIGLVETRDAVVNGDKPRTTTLAAITAHQNTEHNYITVSGTLVPKLAIQRVSKSETSDNENVQNSWVPLVDSDGEHGVFVQLEGDTGAETPYKTTVTGMLVPIDTEMRKKVMEEIGSLPKGTKFPIDLDFMVKDGAHPGDPGLWITTTVLSGLVLALALITLAQKYVVFQKTTAGMPMAVVSSSSFAPPVIDPQRGLDLRLTGKLSLNEKNSQRFLDVPARMVTLETGEQAFASNIDASSRFMGVTTSKRAGIWASIIQPGSLREAEPGRLYVGLATRPALRLHYTDAATARPETVILSCANEAERQTLIQEINRIAGYAVVKA